MVGRQSKQELLAKGEVVAAPAERACTDQTFELPTGLYAAMAVFFTGFVGVLALVLHGGHLAVAFAVIFAFIAAYFSIPWIFPGMASDSRNKPMSWDEFRERGIVTATGHSTAREATILLLLLPSLIFCFGLAVAILWALF
jgi:hypothetical protein